jgi:hypothetical protein
MPAPPQQLLPDSSNQGPLQQQPTAPDASQGTPNLAHTPQVLLGPWASLWVPGLGAAAYDPQVGLPGPCWVPGVNKLQVVRVLAPPAAPTAAESASSSAGEGAAAGSRATQQPQQQQQQRKPDFASQLKRKGAGGRGQGGPVAPPEPVLGPEDFPTLQQALSSKAKPKQHPSDTAATEQQAPVAGKSSSQTQGSQQQLQDAAGASAPRAAEQGAEQQRQLASAWSKLYSATIGTTAATVAEATQGGVGHAGEMQHLMQHPMQQTGQQVGQQQAAGGLAAGGRGGSRGGSRGGGRGTAGAQGRGRQGGAREGPAGAAAVPHPDGRLPVLTALWIGG